MAAYDRVHRDLAVGRSAVRAGHGLSDSARLRRVASFARASEDPQRVGVQGQGGALASADIQQLAVLWQLQAEEAERLIARDADRRTRELAQLEDGRQRA